jgi:hypothetical protein
MINAKLQYHMHVMHPEKLSDEEWAAQSVALERIQKEEEKRFSQQ